MLYEVITEFAPGSDQLLIGKDLLDKQIVDIDGAKVVRVNDVKLSEENGSACVTDVDVGIRGILRRLGIERKGEAFRITSYNVCYTKLLRNRTPG